jgi:hypothetical protein
MLCSATPTLMNRSGYSWRNLAMLPAGEMSATTMKIRGSLHAIS